MNLASRRRAVRPLLDERKAADAMAAHYAFYYPDDKTSLIIAPAGASRARGYLAISRTGMDLFRPLVTMRLPLGDHQDTAELFAAALPPETPAIFIIPEDHRPLVEAFVDIQVEDRLRILELDPNNQEPVINVLVTQEIAPNGYPRFIIRSQHEKKRVVASAGINWQTPRFAEISVYTEAGQRRQGYGKSVVSALSRYLLDGARLPLYSVSEANPPSLQLAESSGFVDRGIRKLFIEGTRRPSQR
jgi:RimJ/RimL family protein N-acetyltransferase